MNFLKKLMRKIKNGEVKEILGELLWVWRYMLRYKWQMTWYIGSGLIGMVMGLGSSVVSKYIIDIVTGYDSSSIARAGCLYIGMQVMQLVSNLIAGRISAKISIRVEQEIQADVFDRLMKADWLAMSDYHSGDILSRLNGDVNTISSFVLSFMPNLITQVVQFAGALCIILYYDATLALLALLSAPVTMIVSKFVFARMRGHNKKVREASAQLLSFNEETFQNIQFVKSFGLGGLFGQRLRALQGVYRKEQLDYNLFSLKTNAILSSTGMIVRTLCFGWGIFRLWRGFITYGTMTLFLQMASRLSSSFSSLIGIVPGIVSAATSAGRIMAVTELKCENLDEIDQARALSESARHDGLRLCARDFSFSYADGAPVFSHAGMEIRSGEITALVGPSGEGKTTFLRLLLGLINPQSGVLQVSSGPSQMNISASTRLLFSYVPQGNTIFSGTVASNMRLVRPDATDKEIIQALKEACAYDFIEKLEQGINTPVKERGGGFSEGQAQRLAIARAAVPRADHAA